MGNHRIILLLVLLLVLAIGGGLYATYFLSAVTGKAVISTEKETLLKDYSYTTAICNSDNECIDIIITCKNNSVSKIEPSSDLLKLPEDWQDIRQKNSSYCS